MFIQFQGNLTKINFKEEKRKKKERERETRLLIYINKNYSKNLTK